jgi:hypothetical protein
MPTQNETVISDLAPIQERITGHETKSIEARWEFGGRLLEMRVGKQLPRGLRADVTRRFDIENSEITRRMKLAEKFKTVEEVIGACEKYGGAWREIIRQELTEAAQQVPSTWGKRAELRLHKLVEEAGNDRALRGELAKVLQAALDKLTVDTAKLVA